jgi:hypothetical protein
MAITGENRGLTIREKLGTDMDGLSVLSTGPGRISGMMTFLSTVGLQSANSCRSESLCGSRRRFVWTFDDAVLARVQRLPRQDADFRQEILWEEHQRKAIVGLVSSPLLTITVK